MKTTLIYAYLIAGVSLAACSHGQPPVSAAPAAWTIEPIRTAMKSGDSTTVRVDARLGSGWHIYSVTQPAGGPIATRISLPTGQPFVLAGDPAPTEPPHVAFDDAFHMSVQLHEKAVAFTVPVRMTGPLTGSDDSVHVRVRYQVCNASLCYPPQIARLATPVGPVGS